MTAADEPRPPLAGVRVLEIGGFLAGPFCTAQLADLGADVVKVETPGRGDELRHKGTMLDGVSSTFARANRNKRSVALDLKSERGRELFLELVDEADVIVENLRPGAMARFELAPELLLARNPRLIYASISGFGTTGPYSDLAGLDIIAQAMSGLMSITGEEDRGPAKAGVPICDLTCALYGAMAVLAALRARDADGQGQFLEVCLLEAGTSLTVWEAGSYLASGAVPGRSGSAHQSTAPYQAFAARDGHLVLGAASPKLWGALCEALGLQELLDDDRFVDNATRHANRDVLASLIEAVLATEDVEHWLAKLQAVGVPCGPIQTYDDVLADRHLRARAFFPIVPHATLGPIEVLGSPMRLARTPVRTVRGGPLLGEQSAEVLAEVGVNADELARLVADGIVGIDQAPASAGSP